MKNQRMTRQGLPDLNYSGPKRTPAVAPGASEPATPDAVELVAPVAVPEPAVAAVPAAV